MLQRTIIEFSIFILHFFVVFYFFRSPNFPERLFSKSSQESSPHFCSLTSQFYNSGAMAIVNVVRHKLKAGGQEV